MPKFSFLYDIWIQFFNELRKFLSQRKKNSNIELPKRFLSQLIYCIWFYASFVRELCKLHLVQEEKHFESTLQ